MERGTSSDELDRKRRRTNATRPPSRNRLQPLTFVQSPSDCNDLIRTLQEMRDKGLMCDLTFRVGGIDMQVHRAVVAASNTALGAMLRSGMKESTQDVIELDDEEDPELFGLLLDFLYAKPIDVKHANTMLLLSLACKYQLESLKDQICESMAPAIEAESCCSILATADTFECISLRDHALNKLFNTFASATKSKGFLELSHDQVISVLSSDGILDCDESVVFEAAVRWLKHDNSREHHKNSVLSVVRFPVMDAGYLSDVVKTHPIMKGAVPARLIMEAFEHHALRASGRQGLSSPRTTPRRRSCSFNSATLLNGHQDAISALYVFGDKLISGSWDCAVKVWNTESWICERTLSDHTGTIRGLTSCDGKVISSSDDGTIKVWNPEGWSLVRTLEGHEESVNCVIECMGRLASASDDGSIKLWNTFSWTCEVTIHHGPTTLTPAELNDGEEAPVNNNFTRCGVLCIVCCGDKLVSASDDAQLKVWNTHSWVCEHVTRAHNAEIWAMMVTDEGWLVSGSVDGTIRIWDPNTWTCDRVLSSHSGPVYAIISLDGKVLTAGGDAQIIVWRNDWSLERRLNARGVWTLTVYRGKLVSGGIDAKIKIWT